MSRYLITNRLSTSLFVPPPVGRTLRANAGLEVNVPSASMDTPEIRRMMNAGLIALLAILDDETPEDIEVAPVALAGGGGGGLPDPVGNAGYALFSDGAAYVLREVRESDIAAAFAIDTFAVTTATREVGESVSPASFTATYVRTPTSAVLTDDNGSLPIDVTATPAAFTSTGPFTKTVNNQTVTFTLTADDGVDPADIATTVMRWRPRAYYGVGINQLSATEAFIEALASSQLLASRNVSFSVNAGATDHIYYAFPASYGTPTFTVNGFAGGFELVGSVNVTNTYGVTQSYVLWKSTNANLGSTTVVVS